jgi:hypothetical protein
LPDEDDIIIDFSVLVVSCSWLARREDAPDRVSATAFDKWLGNAPNECPNPALQFFAFVTSMYIKGGYIKEE